jgi:hypothetical protein
MAAGEVAQALKKPHEAGNKSGGVRLSRGYLCKGLFRFMRGAQKRKGRRWKRIGWGEVVGEWRCCMGASGDCAGILCLKGAGGLGAGSREPL